MIDRGHHFDCKQLPEPPDFRVKCRNNMVLPAAQKMHVNRVHHLLRKRRDVIAMIRVQGA
jgi:hypothetical protein